MALKVRSAKNLNAVGEGAARENGCLLKIQPAGGWGGGREEGRGFLVRGKELGLDLGEQGQIGESPGFLPPFWNCGRLQGLPGGAPLVSHRVVLRDGGSGCSCRGSK
jgi:hypothetical protein